MTFIDFDDQYPGYFKPLLSFENLVIDFSSYHEYKIKTNIFLFNLLVPLVLPLALEIAKRKLQSILGTVVSFAINDQLFMAIPETIDITQNVMLYIRFIQKIAVGGHRNKRVKIELNQLFDIQNIKKDGEKSSKAENSIFNVISQHSNSKTNIGIRVIVNRSLVESLGRIAKTKIKNIL